MLRQHPPDGPRTLAASGSAPVDSRQSPRVARGDLAGDAAAFLQGFLRHPAQVGSVIPSSHWLERRLVRAARLEQAAAVVELGPGTGGTTRAFLRAMRHDARLLAIELSSEFHARLSRRMLDPRLQLQLGSAEHIAEFLAARRLPAPQAVISGIPFSTMPTEVADRIARAVADVLAPGGRFVAYQVRAHVAGFVTPYLGPPVRAWELLNVPPVQVFTWVKAGA
jgi:phosphatidylethanolamine/phosphatidyl-N-methylethanolamine N-methyltransferase